MKDKITLRISLEKHLQREIKRIESNIETTNDNSKTFWVGYHQALIDLRNNFYLTLSLPSIKN